MGWQQVQSTNPNNVYGFDADPNFAAFRRQYEQYAITSCAWEYIPFGVSNNTSPGYSNLIVTDDPDTLDMQNLSDTDRLKIDSTKLMDGNKRHRRFINLRKISSQMDKAWQDTASYLPGIANELTNGSTGFWQSSFDPQNSGRTYAIVRLTWYVTFRG